MPRPSVLVVIVIIVITLGLVPATRIDAQTVTVSLNPDRDNTLYEDPTGDLSNGSGPSFFAGRTNQGASSLRRAVLHFDVAGTLPPGATVLSAELILEVSGQPQIPSAESFDLHPLLADWGEGASVAGGPGGLGAAAQPGDATWVHRFFPASPWATPGGDFDPTASAVQSVAGLAPHTWGPSLQMAADVQGWLEAPASNFGWILIGDEGSSGTARRFDSREGSTPPELVITYGEPAPQIPTLSAPAALVLAILLGMAAFWWLRRRQERALPL